MTKTQSCKQIDITVIICERYIKYQVTCKQCHHIFSKQPSQLNIQILTMTLVLFVLFMFTFLQGCKNENMTTKVLVLPRSYMNCYFCYTGDITGLGYEKLGLNTCGDFGPDDRSHLKMCSPGQTCKQCLTMLR